MSDEDESEADEKWEGPDPAEMDDPNAPPMIDCPHCGKMIHEQAEWCHLCGKYLSEEDREHKVPTLVMIGTLLGLLGLAGGFLLWIFT